jgi:hypothetical protein
LYSMSAIWDGNYAYLFGGYDGYSYFDHILRYDPTQDQLTTMVARLPSGLKWTSAVWTGTYAYIFGGRTPSGVSNQIVRYDPTSDSIALMSATLPENVLGTSAVWTGSCAYIFGGRTMQNVDSSGIFKYDPNLDLCTQVQDSLPSPRAETCAIWDGNSAFIFGGSLAASVKIFDEIVRFSPAETPNETAIFTDDFESYGAGSFPSSGGWELVWNGMGTEYQVVTDAVSHSPTRSFQLLGQVGWSANVQRRFTSSSSVIGYEAYVRCEGNVASADNVASICMWNLEGQAWGKRFAGVYFASDGYVYTEPIHSEPVYFKLMPYDPNTWYKVRVVIDRTAGEYNVWIDDALLAQNIAIQDTNQIEALMLAEGWAGFRVYFDDVKVFEGAPAPTHRRFSPIIDCYGFRNIIPVGKIGYWDTLRALSSSPWVQSIPIEYWPLLAWFSVEVQNSLDFGNCFGMSYTAKYYYENPSLFETKYLGYANLHAVGMDVASPEIIVNQFPGQEVIPPYFFNLIMTYLGVKSTNEEMQWLMTQCDNYHVVPLYLVGTILGTNSLLVHCVLVYNYARSPDGNRLDLSIYDSNDMLFQSSSSFSGSTYYLTLEKDAEGNFVVSPTGSTNDITNWYGLTQIGCGDYSSVDWSKVSSHINDLLNLIWGYLQNTNGNLLGIRLDCPVDVMVTDPAGKRIGYDSSSQSEINEITGAFYSGPSTEPQVILIPDPVNDMYSITLVGTATGSYTLTTEYVTATQNSRQAFNGIISPQGTKYYSTLLSGNGQMTAISWEYVFKDTKRGTMLKISTDDKYFQFIAPDKDFGIKHDPHMTLLCGVIVIGYGDAEMRLVATAIGGKISVCAAIAWDKQTNKMYLLVSWQLQMWRDKQIQ